VVLHCRKGCWCIPHTGWVVHKSHQAVVVRDIGPVVGERHMGFVAEDHMDFVIAEVGAASGPLA